MLSGHFTVSLGPGHGVQEGVGAVSGGGRDLWKGTVRVFRRAFVRRVSVAVDETLGSKSRPSLRG